MAYKPAYIWNGTNWDQIGNQAVASLDDYALLDPSASANQTITNTKLVAPSEKVSVAASATTGTVNYDISDYSILYYTSNSTGNFTLNIRGDSSTTLDSLMEVGESYSINFLNTNGATPYYATAYQIDGSAVTPKWQYGAAPSAGNASSIDIYNLTIVKTAATPTYVVFAAMAKFA